MQLEPLTTDIIIAVIQVYECIHGHNHAASKLRDWAADKIFTHKAYRVLTLYIANYE